MLPSCLDTKHCIVGSVLVLNVTIIIFFKLTKLSTMLGKKENFAPLAAKHSNNKVKITEMVPRTLIMDSRITVPVSGK